MTNRRVGSARVAVLCAFAFIAVAVLLVLGIRHSESPPNQPPATEKLSESVIAPSPASATATNLVKSTSSAPVVTPNYADFQKRPFPVSQESGEIQWTLADGKDTNVIRKLAHNPLEYDRMVAENARIIRRQLVYHNDTADAQIQRAKLTGQPIQQLILPGLDGQKVQFEITATDLNPSGQQGMFSGHVAGQPDSLVTFAFKGGREAFTILDPSQNINLVSEPREPGELIVKLIDPEKYTAGANCGN